ncbi:mannonate dehydratase [Lederbergia lenta]|uniref:Mannonate dehydratase n=1 Tax=Lederbergia lenta TaxID=1467 RepID=A0A2X4VT74_LEDLE|nr:mannonate dehydratase [Lederbergia lenta]MEC2325690.1 mannonate dehydratase [Lederbergia lenta]SQI53941.1 mannonate dehydratase [Lederbergia lenta]
MKVSFRWFGSKDDSVSLAHIKQIPGIEGIVGTLPDIPAGELWPLDRISALKEEVAQYGLKLEVIESVNIHEDIKLGLPTRDHYIENYIATIRNLSQIGIKVICYNFMPIFDWIRSDLAKVLADGSSVLAYEKAKVETVDPSILFGKMEGEANGFSLPGWEKERLKLIKELFELYKEVTEEDLFENLKYFLEKVIPVAEECGIKMAIHPDDPPWSVFGLPRIVTNKENMLRIIQLVDSPSNGLTICSGSLGANPENNIPEIMKYFCEIDRVPFVHIRNIKLYENGDFEERSHLNSDGSLDMVEIVKSLHAAGFTGYFRPDHGRMIWDEEARPGYGLYDRALGIMYILGIWDNLENLKKEGVKCFQSTIS